ncbi:MAG: hypothetical protein AB1635_10015 [Acidobacteriota bacterium]
MFAALTSLSVSRAALVRAAEGCTPRFQPMGPVVLLDVAGLSRLFGGPRAIGDELVRAVGDARAAVRVGVAPTATGAVLLALGRPGLTVVATAGELAARLAPLPVRVLADLERVRLEGAVDAAAPPAAPASGWGHPRDTHQAQRTRRPRPACRATPDGSRAARAALEACLHTLHTWGITTVGALAALPAAELSERLGARGRTWHRLARGEDDRPLVAWVAEEAFEAALDLEWPIEGLEPLSFVLARLLEPLADRLERADRGAAVLHTHLHLVSRDVHRRALQLPAPMRDAKTLRTLALLDLESHPPAAAVDRVSVLIEPTPARMLQWTLFERAQPAPEQVSTLLARLTALMGEGHVGSPRLVDAWQPGAFALAAFEPAPPATGPADAAADGRPLTCALRRFRLPVPARVTVADGRPVRLQVDRRGLATGAIVQAAGPWRTSGHWWPAFAGSAAQASTAAAGTSPAAQASTAAAGWDRDEWDVVVAGGVAYRLSVERAVGQWFIEGIVD